MKFILNIICVLFSYSAIAEKIDATPAVGINKEFSTSNISSFGLRGKYKVSLTFDDGPTKRTTPAILDAIKHYQDRGYDISATFFVLGNKAKYRTSTLQRMKDENHIVANHTFTHPSLSKPGYANRAQLFNELIPTHNIIKAFMPEVSDLSKRWYFRAPFGAWKAQRALLANSDNTLVNYVGPIFWDVGGVLKFDARNSIYSAADWACWSKKVSVKTCAIGYMKEVVRKKGGVILLHDINFKSAELTKYLLVGLTGVNLFDDSKYSSILDAVPTREFDFVSLDDIEALDKYDLR